MGLQKGLNVKENGRWLSKVNGGQRKGLKRDWERWTNGSSGGSQKKKAKRCHRVPLPRKAVGGGLKKVCEM